MLYLITISYRLCVPVGIEVGGLTGEDEIA